jgi:hypothetical protein
VGADLESIPKSTESLTNLSVDHRLTGVGGDYLPESRGVFCGRGGP